ncbi:MAG: class I SAM-dependent methyltransferase [Gammaproteobacteria bacterium]|nr:class I SAM-dependent methyltransferase [Gammaproteobacteria bacterium]
MSSTQHWDSYWQLTASVNSFAEGESATGYHGELLDLWHEQLSVLPTNSVIVDIGTGNGAIAILAQQYSDKNSCNWAITGIDAAMINPKLVLNELEEVSDTVAKISFIATCSVEQMPFADGSIDLLTSQFAVEYAELEQALKECMRVLKKGGCLVAIMHHPDSDISIDSKVGIQVLSQFLFDTPFFVVARKLFESLYLLRTQKANEQLTVNCQRLNVELLQLAQQIKLKLNAEQMNWFEDVMAKIGKLLVNLQPENLQLFNLLQESLHAYYKRLEDQQRASIDNASAAELKSLANELSASYSLEPIFIEEKLFGWLFQCRK